jgi:hypothetical protein
VSLGLLTLASGQSRRHDGLVMARRITPRRFRSPRGPLEHQPLVVQALLCAKRTIELLFRQQLHLRRARIGALVTLPDGRKFTVFRESVCDGDAGSGRTTLAVWFHLRGIPAGSRVRRFLFERLCLANTVLFAGFAGYRVKLWMVDPISDGGLSNTPGCASLCC